jgi:hypothetical protein
MQELTLLWSVALLLMSVSCGVNPALGITELNSEEAIAVNWIIPIVLMLLTCAIHWWLVKSATEMALAESGEAISKHARANSGEGPVWASPPSPKHAKRKLVEPSPAHAIQKEPLADAAARAPSAAVAL